VTSVSEIQYSAAMGTVNQFSSLNEMAFIAGVVVVYLPAVHAGDSE